MVKSNYNRITHIINELYKIKSINRKKPFVIEEIRKKVLSDKKGIEVLKRLKAEGVTLQWLKQNNFTKVAEVYQDLLKDK